jgi:hypothetical protein
MDLRIMNHYPKRTLPFTALLAATLLVACGANSGAALNSTDAINAIYTTAAGTIEAEYTASVGQSVAAQNTASSPTDTLADLGSSTNLPVLTYLSSTPILDSGLNTASSSACDQSVYLSDVTIPDNTVVAAGQTFTKTWMFQNAGSCTWDANYTLTFISGDQMSGVNTPIAATVVPGVQAALSVALTAPTTPGTYTGYWQLANDSGTTFGVEVYVLIDVTQDSTATPTVTPETPTVSATEVIPTPVAATAVAPTMLPTTAVPPAALSTASK